MHAATCMLEVCYSTGNLVDACCIHVACNMHALGCFACILHVYNM